MEARETHKIDPFIARWIYSAGYAVTFGGEIAIGVHALTRNSGAAISFGAAAIIALFAIVFNLPSRQETPLGTD